MQDHPPTQDRRDLGQSLVEFALILPILLLLIFGIIDFGRALFTYAQASNSLRDSLRYSAIQGPASDPNYLNCQAIASAATNRIWFANTTTATLNYTATGGAFGPIVYTNGAYVSGTCPSNTGDFAPGDQLLVETQTQMNLIAPIISSIVPDLTFELGGTRTLTAGGVTYGESVAGPGDLAITNMSCNFNGTPLDPSDDWLEIEWSDTSTTVTEYRIYNNDYSPNNPVGVLAAGVADIEGGSPLGDNQYACGFSAPNCTNQIPLDPGVTTAQRYAIAGWDGSTESIPSAPVAQECPLPNPPSAPVLTNAVGVCNPLSNQVNLRWTHDGTGSPSSFKVYQDTVLASTITAPTKRCSNCGGTWNGSADSNYYVDAYNGAAVSSNTLTVLAASCTGSGPINVNSLSTTPTSGTLSNNCGAELGSTLVHAKSNSVYSLSGVFPSDLVVTTGQNFTFNINSSNASTTKDTTLEVTLNACDASGGTCDAFAFGSAVIAASASDAEVSVTVPVTVNKTIGPGTTSNDHRIQVQLYNNATSGGSPTLTHGFGDCFLATRDANLALP